MFAYFTPRRASIRDLLPLSVAMCLNVILPNLSLAFSSVTFYQIARILLTPTVALMNFVLYKATLPRNAILALIPACLGVGMVSYYDSLPTSDSKIKTTSSLGVFFAFTGIFASSLYTVWIASYHRKLQMSSMQLLYNQAPIASFLLLYVIPFVDTFPDWMTVPGNRWLMIGMVSRTVLRLSRIVANFLSPVPSPLSSTFLSFSSSPKPAPCQVPLSATSRPAQLSLSAGWSPVVPSVTSRSWVSSLLLVALSGEFFSNLHRPRACG